MSSYITDIKNDLKLLLSLYARRKDLHSVAFSGNYNELKNIPTSPYYNQVNTSLVDFSGEDLKTYEYGGKINFRYKNSSVPTSTITELNNKLRFDTDEVSIRGNLTSDGYATINGIKFSKLDNDYATFGSYGLNINSYKIVLKNDGSISAKSTISTEGSVNSNGIVTESGIISKGAINTSGNIQIGTESVPSAILLETNGKITANGQIYSNGVIESKTRIIAPVIQGEATEADWADLAEIYKSDKKYSVGTLIQFGGKEEITLARTEANGVISEKPGYLLNSKEDGLPVALCGRVKVLVKGKVNKFDKISLAAHGVGEVSDKNPIARALESKDDESEGLVLCVTQFRL